MLTVPRASAVGLGARVRACGPEPPRAGGLSSDSVSATGLPDDSLSAPTSWAAWGPGQPLGAFPGSRPAEEKRRSPGAQHGGCSMSPSRSREALPTRMQAVEASDAGSANSNLGWRASCCPGSRVDVPPSL